MHARGEAAASLDVAALWVAAWALLRARGAGLLAGVAVPGGAFVAVWVAAGRMDLVGAPGAALFLALLQLLVFCLFAVSGLRVLLLGPGAVPRFGIATWSAREGRFLGWLLLVYLAWVSSAMALTVTAALVLSGPAAVSLALVRGLFWLSLVPAGWVLARVVLVLPAAAVGDRRGLGEVWRATRGAGWRLAAGVSVIPAVLAVLCDPLLAAGLPAWGQAGVALAGAALVLLEFALLGAAYGFLFPSSRQSPVPLPQST